MSRLARLVAALLAGCAVAPAGAGPLAGYDGETLYARFCASCHGSTGRGDGPVAAALAVVVPDLSLLARRGGGRVDIGRLAEVVDGRAVVVAHGTRYMPVWGYEFFVDAGADAAAEAEARALVDRLVRHVLTLQRPAAAPGGASP